MSEVEFEAAGLRELGYGDEIVSDFINLDDKSKIIKDLPSAGEEKRKYLNLINSFTQKEKVSEGQHTCNSCGSKSIAKGNKYVVLFKYLKALQQLL